MLLNFTDIQLTLLLIIYTDPSIHQKPFQHPFRTHTRLWLRINLLCHKEYKFQNYDNNIIILHVNIKYFSIFIVFIIQCIIINFVIILQAEKM